MVNIKLEEGEILTIEITKGREVYYLEIFKEKNRLLEFKSRDPKVVINMLINWLLLVEADKIEF